MLVEFVKKHLVYLRDYLSVLKNNKIKDFEVFGLNRIVPKILLLFQLFLTKESGIATSLVFCCSLAMHSCFV